MNNRNHYIIIWVHFEDFVQKSFYKIAVGGTFLTSVYTLARFLSGEKGKADDVLSSQGSAMAIRKIIEEKKNSLTLFKKL